MTFVVKPQPPFKTTQSGQEAGAAAILWIQSMVEPLYHSEGHERFLTSCRLTCTYYPC